MGNEFSTLYSPNGRTIVTARALKNLACIDTSLDLEIREIDGDFAALAVLRDSYPPDKQVHVLNNKGEIIQSTLDRVAGFEGDCVSQSTVGKVAGAGFEGGCVSQPALEKTDFSGGSLVAVFICGDGGFFKQRYCFGDLVRIIRRLTSSDGCPWDRVQTHESIAGNMIEEAYEAASAALSGNISDMREEFGDVLLQPVLNCDIAERSGEFGLNDCIDELCTKLYTRHTHIFGSDKAAGAGEALHYWEQAKAVEKSISGATDKIDKLPHLLPALMRCQKTIKAILKERPATEEALLQSLKNELETSQNLPDSRVLLLITALFVAKKADAESTLLKQTNQLKNAFSASKSGDDFLKILDTLLCNE